MQALSLTDAGPRYQSDYPMPRPREDEALIRVRLAGVCATDLQLIAGYKDGFRGVLGHEFVGEVVDAPGDPAWVGARVVGEINVGCGSCNLCRRGLGKHCRERTSMGIIGRDGAFADYCVLPIANLHRVPDTLDDAQAVFAEPLAAALQILEQVHIRPETRAVVVGDGRLGQLIAQVLALTGCDLTVHGRHEQKLARLATRGIDTVNVSQVEALPGPVDADVVVEATGSAGGFAAARRLVRPGGTLVLKSTFAGEQPPVDLSGLVVDEVTLVGSRCGPFGPALRLLAQGQVDVLSLIDARVPLAQGAAALQYAGRRGVLKVLLEP